MIRFGNEVVGDTTFLGHNDRCSIFFVPRLLLFVLVIEREIIMPVVDDDDDGDDLTLLLSQSSTTIANALLPGAAHASL
jgi:hypothetical protein